MRGLLMDPYDMLDLTVEELVSLAKEMHKFSCRAYWQDEVDFEFDIESDTYEEGIKQVAERLASPEHYPCNVEYQTFYNITLPIKNEDGVYRAIKFESCDHEWYDTSHKYSREYEIKRHPAYVAKKLQIEEEEKKKRDNELRAVEIRKREQELAIYEKVKKELGL